MDEQARKKEARRTLKRIKRTLVDLDDSPPESLEQSEEYQRIKNLLESGYSHNPPAFINKIKSLLWYPAVLVLLILAILLFSNIVKF